MPRVENGPRSEKPSWEQPKSVPRLKVTVTFYRPCSTLLMELGLGFKFRNNLIRTAFQRYFRQTGTGPISKAQK